jgi:glutamate formiminotransferase / 5-formyltetrahydrofolate cyclo-ligase
MTHLIECVPNVSEGIRASVVERIAGGLRAIARLRLLDYSADPSHNRSVFTMAGDNDALEEAVLNLVAIAVDEIDLRSHRGEHPRIGAVDVVPFIPIDGATMDDCVALARTVGRAIAERFAIPVYLYEESSSNPARKRLQDIRRGQFEGLAHKMADEDWTPDFGPRSPHPTAGATVVGARAPLIAYNVNLATNRVDIARRVAASVRESSGGLPCVKALGVTLAHRGIAQVSMNLTNFEKTPIQVVFDRVAAEAAREGVDVLDSELIGLIPAAALRATTPEYLRLRDFSESQILEKRILQMGSNPEDR